MSIWKPCDFVPKNLYAIRIQTPTLIGCKFLMNQQTCLLLTAAVISAAFDCSMLFQYLANLSQNLLANRSDLPSAVISRAFDHSIVMPDPEAYRPDLKKFLPSR
ncbi:MAG: hypothetical protein ABI212_11745 [Burkholderiaceae bacterium]